MDKRYVSVWFPYLLSDWLIIRQPAFKDKAFVVVHSERGRVLISDISKTAAQQGISKNMLLADAKALVPGIEVIEEQEGMAERILTRLGKWCIRFTPVVATDMKDGLILDSSGCAHLWGGEQPYLKTILDRLAAAGYHCIGAIAGTIGAAWAITRYGENLSVIEPNRQYQALLPLVPAALRLETPVTDRLHKLGLTKIASFIRMPGSVLRRRFGKQLLLRLGQALGTVEETIQPLIVIPPYEARLPCLEPVRTRAAIEVAIQNLLEILCLRLSKEGLGMRHAVLKGYRIDGRLTQVQIGTNQPSHEVNHLFKLFELKITSIEPALGIELFTLTAVRTEPVQNFQEKIWSAPPGLADQRLAQLLDRLAGKIGEQAIRRYLPAAHYWPERSLKPAVSLSEAADTNWNTRNPRPVELLHKPLPVQVTAPIPDYPPMNFIYNDTLHTIKKADGPERIEREWWLDQGEHRDYYIVEDEKGQRYWLFRSGHYLQENSQWFIHGFFA